MTPYVIYMLKIIDNKQHLSPMKSNSMLSSFSLNRNFNTTVSFLYLFFVLHFQETNNRKYVENIALEKIKNKVEEKNLIKIK